MENGWKMEDGKWKPDSSPLCVLLGSRGEVRQVGLSEESPYRTLPTSGLVGPARMASWHSLSVIEVRSLRQLPLVDTALERAFEQQTSIGAEG